MFLLVLIFKTMKKIFIYLCIANTIFSCVKDAEHRLSEDDFDIMLLSSNVFSDNTGLFFQGILEKQSKEEIIDHGFIFGTRRTDHWSFNENDFENWLNESSDKIIRDFLLANGSRVALGKLEDIKNFRHEQHVNIAPGKKYLVVAYLTTKDYTIYSEVKVILCNGSKPPIIERIEPAEISCYMNQITVYGKNFCSNKEDIKIDWWKGYIQSVSMDSIVIGLSNVDIGTNTIELSIFDKTVPITFEAVGLIIESIEPQTAEIESVVTIKGRNLENTQEVLISDTRVEILEKNDTEIKIRIPVLKEGQAKLKIRDTKYLWYHNPNHEFILPFDILILSPWKSIEFPFLMHHGVFCNYQNKLYTLNNMSIYQLDMQNKTYQPIAKMTEEPFWTDVMSYFMIGSKFYICTQSDLFLSYDIATDTWEKLQSYTHTIYNSPTWYNLPVICFSIGEKGYAVSYCSTFNKNTLIEYNSSSKTWKEIADVTHIFSPWFSNNATVTTFNSKAYISVMDRIWEFDSQLYLFKELFMAETSHWTGAAQLFANNDLIYIINYSDFIEYNPATKHIKYLPRFVYSFSSAMFLWDNFLYAKIGEGYEYIVFDLNLIEK